MGLEKKVPKAAWRMFAPGFHNNLVDVATLRRMSRIRDQLTAHNDDLEAINPANLEKLVKTIWSQRNAAGSKSHIRTRRCRRHHTNSDWRSRQRYLKLDRAIARLKAG